MHELALTSRVFDIALAYAQDNDASKICAIHLRIGEIRDIQNEWMQHYFDYLSRGTIAEGAKLEIVRVPLRLACKDCLESFEAKVSELSGRVCSQCGGSSFSIISGQEFSISSIEVV